MSRRRELRAARKKADARGFFLADVRGSAAHLHAGGQQDAHPADPRAGEAGIALSLRAYAQNPTIIDLSLDDTLRIYDAVMAGDAAAAKAMTEALIREIWMTMRDAMSALFGEA